MYIFFDRCDLGIDNNNENGYRVAAIFAVPTNAFRRGWYFEGYARWVKYPRLSRGYLLFSWP